MWYAEVLFINEWVRLPGVYATRELAEWTVGVWKEEIKCYGDPFRYIEVKSDPKPKEMFDFGTNAEGHQLGDQLAAQNKCRQLQKAGEKHDTYRKNLGNCYNEYGCRTCGFKYSIDSSD